MSRKGILLLNLGSPKSTAVPDVRNYLREFLNDDRVIDYPAPLRWLLLEGIILRTRPKKSAAALDMSLSVFLRKHQKILVILITWLKAHFIQM